jgi:putative peptide zinc metalloprotease protein
MAQLRLAYPEIERRGAEVLQVTHNTPEEAARYARWYPIAFPYLCDSERIVHERYGLALEPTSPLAAVRSFAAATGDLVLRGERTASPVPFLVRYGGRDSPQAMFVIDRDGIVRAAFTMGPIDRLPAAADLLRALDALA